MTSRALFVATFILLAFVPSLFAQQSVAAADAPQANGAAQKNNGPQTSAKPATEDQVVFDERAAAKVLGTIRDGLESRSQRRFLSVFDAARMDGFLTFQDQIDAYFNSHESFRVTFRIIQTSGESHHGVILAEFQLEGEPRGESRSFGRQGQLRFELEYGAKGWKIVDFNPRGFFS